MSALYFAQNAIEGRFQEFIPLQKYAAGERISPLVELSKIDRVPVSMVISMEDDICPVSLSEWHFNQIRSKDKFIRFERGGHTVYSWRTYEGFITRMVETIEFGTALPNSYAGGSFFDRLLTEIIPVLFSLFYF